MFRLMGLGILLTALTAFADIASDIDPLFSDYNKPNVPGASVLIVQDGQVLYEKGYGLANLENKQAADEHTNYRLASLTKQFTAMAILILMDEGKIKLDDNLVNVFPEFPAYGKRITIRHLIHHTSGLYDYENLIPSGTTEQITDADVLDLMKKQSGTQFTPGSRYQYSNGGYCLLAQAIERRSGLSFADYVERNIFTPLGMSQSQVFEKGKSVIANRAYGYTKSGAGFSKTDQSITSATQGDGGVYTSAHELFLWDQALYGTVLLPKALMALVFTPGTLSDGSKTKYAFGWEVDTYKGAKRVSHTGSTIGFRTAIQRFPERKLTIAVLINRANTSPWDTARQIADKLL